MGTQFGRARLAIALALTAALPGACVVTQPATVRPRPAPPRIEASGVLAAEKASGGDRTYVLADGRTFTIAIDATRVLWEGGPGEPFVLGSDESGSFVAVFMHQDGLPEDCHIPGIGAQAVERGAFVEVNGVLWRKAATFESSAPLPAEDSAFAGSTRFCFNEQIEVTSAR